jgi:hypothetical protein
MQHALRRPNSDDDAKAVVHVVLPVDDPPPDSKASLMPDLPIPHIASSDAQHVAAHKADYRRACVC